MLIEKRRMASIDILRGLGIAVILIIHRIHYTWTGMGSREELREHMQGWMLPILILTIILFTMAGIFYFISGIVNSYSMYSRVISGRTSPYKCMIGGVSAGLVLVVMNYIHRIFFMNGFISGPGGEEPEYPVGLLTGFIRGGDEVVFRWSQITEPGTLSLIGLILIFISFTLWILFKEDGVKNVNKIYWILFILSFTIFLVTPFLKYWLRPIYITSYEAGNYFSSFIIGHLCLEFGLFPNLSFGFIGAVIGISLIQNENQKKFYKKNKITMAVLILCGIFCVLFFQKDSEFGKWVIGTGISMIELAIFIFLLMILLNYFDFKKENTVSINKFPVFNLRQFGMIALTVYTFEPFAAEILRKIVDISFGKNWNDNLLLSLLFGFLCLILWNFLLNFWRRINFIGSLEWTSAKVLKTISGKKTTKIEFNGLKKSF